MKQEYLEMLRGRLDVRSDDPSKDRFILRMSPLEQLRECCAWEYGDADLADRILDIAKDLGVR